MAHYDLVVIGAGWAGFNAVLHAKKLGKRVCLIERDSLGGTCLNYGCIPTKVLTHFSGKAHALKHGILEFQKERADTIAKLKSGMEFVVKSQKIDFIRGSAAIVSKNKVTVREANQEIDADYILIAAGSSPRDLPFLKFDHQRILSSTDILTLEALPKSLLIVGGGVIGCEFACALARLGVSVTVAEIVDRLVFMFDRDISKKLESTFQKAGITVNTNFDTKDKDLSGYEKILLSVGRKVNVEELFEAGLGLACENNGALKVDRFLKTSLDGIYAAGDCINSPQLAHVASYEARVAVENMFGAKKEADYSAVPSSVFTSPELAQVGINEDEAKKQSRNVTVLKKLFSSVGMAHILKQTDGFLKLIIDNDSGTIIGAGIIGPHATELVNTLTIAVQYKLTVKGLQGLIFAHPSISEIFTEALEA